MDNIEEKFYKTFGIEKRCIRPKDCVRKGICRGAVACDFYTYPEITDRILLELICILSKFHSDNYDAPYQIYSLSPDEIKLEILTNCIGMHDTDKAYSEQVQSLFKGGE